MFNSFLFAIRVVLVASGVILAEEDRGWAGNSYPSRAFGHSWITKISDEALEKSPAWDAKSENPPISARKAMALSQAAVERLVKPPDDHKRWFAGATLEKTQDGRRWFWRVEYIWLSKKGGIGGLPAQMVIIVLMDGKVLEPQVIENQVK